MMLILAQADLSALKADFIKSMIIWSGAMIVLGCMVIGALFAVLTYRLEKKSKREPQKMDITPQPVEVTKTKRLNAAVVESNHLEVVRRLDGHDADIEDLQKKFANEIPEMERRLNEAGEKRSGDIHDRVNDILGEVRELRGEMKFIAKKV